MNVEVVAPGGNPLYFVSFSEECDVTIFFFTGQVIGGLHTHGEVPLWTTRSATTSLRRLLRLH